MQFIPYNIKKYWHDRIDKKNYRTQRNVVLYLYLSQFFASLFLSSTATTFQQNILYFPNKKKKGVLCTYCLFFSFCTLIVFLLHTLIIFFFLFFFIVRSFPHLTLGTFSCTLRTFFVLFVVDFRTYCSAQGYPFPSYLTS
jgi:hypothetical protein